MLSTSLERQIGLDDLHDMRQYVNDTLLAHGLDEELTASLVLVVDEWLTNIITHGYTGEFGEVKISISFDPRDVHICIQDSGVAFDISSTTTAEKEMSVSGSAEGGLGLTLIRRLVSSITYTRLESGWNNTCFHKSLD
ncbi:MAG: ATP-binding protein [Gammaproteobacteria bacterium]|nr:ATP-binding protein [Gammaproteobacteria bacterium]